MNSQTNRFLFLLLCQSIFQMADASVEMIRKNSRMQLEDGEEEEESVSVLPTPSRIHHVAPAKPTQPSITRSTVQIPNLSVVSSSSSSTSSSSSVTQQMQQYKESQAAAAAKLQKNPESLSTSSSSTSTNTPQRNRHHQSRLLQTVPSQPSQPQPKKKTGIHTMSDLTTSSSSGTTKPTGKPPVVVC